MCCNFSKTIINVLPMVNAKINMNELLQSWYRFLSASTALHRLYNELYLKSKKHGHVLRWHDILWIIRTELPITMDELFQQKALIPNPALLLQLNWTYPVNFPLVPGCDSYFSSSLAGKKKKKVGFNPSLWIWHSHLIVWESREVVEAQTQQLLVKHRRVPPARGWRGRGKEREREMDEKKKKEHRPSSELYSWSLALSGSSLITPGCSLKLSENGLCYTKKRNNHPILLLLW